MYLILKNLIIFKYLIIKDKDKLVEKLNINIINI